MLSTVSVLYKQRSKYELQQDSDIVIDKPGIYRMEYTDGHFEWYEHKARYDTVRISGDQVRVAKRLTSSDMPSRKQLSSLSTASQGTAAEGQGIRSIPDQENSSNGNKEEQSNLFDVRDYLCWQEIKQRPFIHYLRPDVPSEAAIWTEFSKIAYKQYSEIIYDAFFDMYYGRGLCGTVFALTAHTLQELAEGRIRLQHRPLPPNDEL